ncbi:MAG TPA: 6-carboxytetrahydropterin synthase [Anaerolinea thermolimosa]|uniref:6-carboxy-5,6,7,8-tetrahydropterin synthase n=1 Tax=Anaerolinea thermolimosa TaxID=229919 RepID=A0A3D1JIH3_9CHLR|nr:6-carboxytetrahydropterin synthase [Anaerolinea thermolimosa]GAP07141.1 6-pyruvoyl-tetrahydropterin synthase [Anaerolinea thermolimosa]HCE18037.1 6-carboxytetrahydropterin synthase [Anaerolinea thermolimosa]
MTIDRKTIEPTMMQEDPFWQIDPTLVLNPPPAYARYKLIMSAFFNAAHSVSFGPSRGNLHRHSYHLRVTAMASALAPDNSLVPYETLRQIMTKITAAYEGTILNNLPPFRTIQPTTEALAAIVAQQIERLARDLPIKIIEVTVMESPTQGVSIQLNPS